MDKIDIKFFEKLSVMYIDFKKLQGKEKKLIIEFAKFIDSSLISKKN